MSKKDRLKYALSVALPIGIAAFFVALALNNVWHKNLADLLFGYSGFVLVAFPTMASFGIGFATAKFFNKTPFRTRLYCALAWVIWLGSGMVFISLAGALLLGINLKKLYFTKNFLFYNVLMCVELIFSFGLLFGGRGAKD